MPQLFIITGSNGAGKSAVGPSYLPEDVQENYSVFDGDLLFTRKQRELFPEVTRSPKEAKRIAYDWLVKHFEMLVDQAIQSNDSFVYEGHFTNDATWDVPKRFKENGYVINLIFFGLANPSLSELRVVERSKSGGHYVPPIEVESNFYGNLGKLNQYFTIIDDLTIVDTSESVHIILLHMINGKVESAIPHNELPDWFTENLPALTEKVKSSQQ